LLGARDSSGEETFALCRAIFLGRDEDAPLKWRAPSEG